MLANVSMRNLAITLVASQLLLSHNFQVNAHPIDVVGDAPPLSRSIGLIHRQHSTDSAQDSNQMIESSLLSLGVQANVTIRSVDQNSEHLVERGLIGDTVKGLLGPLSIIPGVVQVSDILFGDGRDGGLLGKLGFLLAVEPNTNSTSSDPGSDSNKNETAVDQAAQASMRYTLLASKEGRSQVFLVPITNQADVEGPGQNTSVTSTDSTGAKNDTMTVKMMMHMLDKQGVPIVMCASYETSPPSDLGVNACSSDTGADASSDASGSSNVTADASTSSQLFTYRPSTGSLTPKFAKAAGASGGIDNSQPSQEMRMHFVMTASPDEIPSTTQAGDETDSSSTNSTSETSPSNPSPSTTGNPGAADQSMQRITLGRQYVQQTNSAPKLDIVNGKNKGHDSPSSCDDGASE